MENICYNGIKFSCFAEELPVGYPAERAVVTEYIGALNVEEVFKGEISIMKKTENPEERCSKSVTARLMQADDKLKYYYSEIKNELLSYVGVRCSVAWKQEMYKHRRQFVAKILIRGKTLCLYLNLDPAAYAGTTYKVEDVSGKGVNSTTHCLFRIKNNRRMRLAKELIAAVAAQEGLKKGENKNCDYVSLLPYKTDDELVDLGLAKYTEQTDYDDINERYKFGK